MSRPARGFTLVEVLVAVAVLALTMGVFISGGSRYADHGRYIQDKTLALWLAHNRLAEYQLAEKWPDTGRSDGRVKMGTREWEWRSEIEESPDPAVRRADIRIYRIDADNNVDENPLARLSGFLTPRGDETVTGTPDPGALPEGAQ